MTVLNADVIDQDIFVDTVHRALHIERLQIKAGAAPGAHVEIERLCKCGDRRHQSIRAADQNAHARPSLCHQGDIACRGVKKRGLDLLVLDRKRRPEL